MHPHAFLYFLAFTAVATLTVKACNDAQAVADSPIYGHANTRSILDACGSSLEHPKECAKFINEAPQDEIDWHADAACIAKFAKRNRRMFNTPEKLLSSLEDAGCVTD